VLALGADFNSEPRVTARSSSVGSSLLCVGILEPRKNQLFLLEVCSALWTEGLKFELNVVGRVNPHFGAPIVARLESAQEKFPSLHYHAAADDAAVTRLYATARASVFPTIAEGCGLPLLESLWVGVPCVCSDLPVLRENADGGGCLPVKPNDPEAWKTALRNVLTDEALNVRLGIEALTRPLPTWSAAAETLVAALR
jgi:glycosyltransferase involved in cell wall biosynthesis